MSYMTLSVYLDQELATHLNRTANQLGKPRNALIREALKEWLNQRQESQWPPEVLNFRGVRGITPFEKNRKKLRPPRNPFDALSS